MEPAHIPLQDAQTLAQEFKNFTYIVSHDLSGPLRAMVEFSKLLRAEHNDELNEEAKVYLSLIVESGEKVHGMLAGLLDYSRLNTMAKPLKKVDCSKVAQDALLVLDDRVKAAKARIEVLPLPVVDADIDTMMQLFIILIDNALTFHKPDQPPFLRILVQKKEQEYEFIFRDKGIGIDPKFNEHIFKPFQRLHGGKDYPGIGMGLTLARKILDRHSGRIWMEPNEGQGVSFHFTMPIREPVA